MAKTDKIRAHLVFPEKKDNEQEDGEGDPVGVCPECGGNLFVETHLCLGEAICEDCRLVSEVEVDYEKVSRTDRLRSEFKDLFSLAYNQFSEYVGQLEGEEFLSTEILEDCPDHREDIIEIYELAKEAFPEADVLMTEQNSPRNRDNKEFLAYTKDVIIRVCNIDPNAPNITRRIELTHQKVLVSSCVYSNGIYVIQNKDSNLIALDLDEGIELWRSETGYTKISRNYGFEEGIVQTTRNNVNTLFLVSWEDGEIEWEIEDVTAGKDTYIRAWEPAVSDQSIYAGSDEGTVYRIDVTDGTVEEITTLSGEVRAIKIGADSLYVTTAIEYESDDEDENDWSGGQKSYNFSLLSLSKGEVRWKTEFEDPGRDAPRPYVAGDTIVAEANDELKAYDREQGNERWSLAQEDFESKLGLEDSEDSGWKSSLGRSFELKILDSIDATIYCVARLDGGLLTAIDGRTGNIEWVNQEYNTIPYNTGAIHEYNGELVFNHRDNDFLTSFVALNSESGTEEWRFESPGWTGGDKPTGSGFVFITDNECVVFDEGSVQIR